MISELYKETDEVVLFIHFSKYKDNELLVVIMNTSLK